MNIYSVPAATHSMDGVDEVIHWTDCVIRYACIYIVEKKTEIFIHCAGILQKKQSETSHCEPAIFFFMYSWRIQYNELYESWEQHTTNRMAEYSCTLRMAQHLVVYTKACFFRQYAILLLLWCRQAMFAATETRTQPFASVLQTRESNASRVK